MGLDLQDDFNKSKEKLNATKTLAESKEAINSVKQQYDQFQKGIAELQQSLNGAKLNQQFKQVAKNSFEQLFELLQLSRGSSLSSTRVLREILLKVIRQVQVELKDLIISEMLKSLNCSNETTFEANQVIYIKVRSVDISKILGIDPNTDEGKSSYEKNSFDATSLNQVPRSTNKLLRSLIENPGILMSELYGGNYKGVSTNDLFDISFETNNDINEQGKFFKIILKNRPNNINRVSDFLVDYFKTINIIDFNLFITKLIDQLTGAFSFNAGYGSAELTDQTKLGKIVQRILGMCFDFESEINVGGTAKTPELDDVNDTFFELSEVELRSVDQSVANIMAGLVVYESCDNVSLPISNTNYLMQELTVTKNDGSNMSEVLDTAIGSMLNDPRWKLAFPFPNQLNLSISFDMILKMPLTLALSILSPKIMLPLVVMHKSIGLTLNETKKDTLEFLKQFKKFFMNIVSKIGAIFIRTFFEQLKKDILRLTRVILKDLIKEKQSVKAQIILALLDSALFIIQTINDFRKCKSLVASILQLFSLKPSLPGPNLTFVPPPLLPLSSSLQGTSVTTSYNNVIEQMQKLGLPTGPNADGTPNLGLLQTYATIYGMKKDQFENGKCEIYVPATTVAAFGGGTTIPQFQATGKYI
jgi:hypothetical protein